MRLHEFDDSPPPPRVSKIGQRGQYTIYAVDGDLIRTNDPTFELWRAGNAGGPYGINYSLQAPSVKVPPNEIWIDTIVPPDGWIFLIERILLAQRLGEMLIRPAQIDDVLAEQQKWLESRREGAKTKIEGSAVDIEDVIIKEWVKLSADVPATVYIVDGDNIRRALDDTFFRVGTAYDSLYIPKGQIWIDGAVSGPERSAALALAIGMHKVMSAGGGFKDAIRRGSILEARVNQDPDSAPELLYNEGIAFQDDKTN